MHICGSDWASGARACCVVHGPMNALSPSVKHSAPGQYLGFALQPVRMCFYLLSSQNGATVSLEHLDDVAVHFPDGMDRVVNDTSLGPRQRFVIMGLEKQLFVWGTVSYEDVFGDAWHTNFCHQYRFYKIGEEVKIQDFYYQRHNSGT